VRGAGSQHHLRPVNHNGPGSIPTRQFESMTMVIFITSGLIHVALVTVILCHALG
jgi:hypothetical protein